MEPPVPLGSGPTSETGISSLERDSATVAIAPAGTDPDAGCLGDGRTFGKLRHQIVQRHLLTGVTQSDQSSGL